jgi:peptide deformylase
MPIREIRTIGDPVLRAPARDLSPEEIRSEAGRALVADLIDSMHAADGIGIAAPQIGEALRAAVIEIPSDGERYGEQEATELMVVFNPRITVLDTEEQEFWEGCLSVPDLRAPVARPRKVRVEFLDADANPCVLEAEDFLATVVQHELDHLDGVLFLDRVTDMTRVYTIENFRRYVLEAEDDVQQLD